MRDKQGNITLLIIGSINFSANFFKVAPSSYPYPWLGILVPFIPMVFGWIIYKAYDVFGEKTKSENFTKTVWTSCLISVVFILFLSFDIIPNEIRAELSNMVISLAICAGSLFSLFTVKLDKPSDLKTS